MEYDLDVDLPLVTLVQGICKSLDKYPHPLINADFGNIPNCEAYKVRLTIERIDG